MHKDFIDAARENKEVLILDFVGVALDNCVYHTSKDTADYVASINAEYLVNVNVLEYACASINYENAEKLYSASQNINIKKVKL